MLRSLEDVVNVALIATDGEIGKIGDFLFDDQSWTVRYVVVDVGSWLTRRNVVISVSVIDQPDWNAKTFRVHLTREQIRHSPDVDSKKPVSRQQEIAMRAYFGWSAYWHNPEFPSPPLAVGRKFPVPSDEDQHLRSTEHVTGYEVRAMDGDVGRVENFIVDEACWHISYLDVKTGDWLHRRSMLVPTRSVTSVSWSERCVNLDYTGR
jgi:uncharacterized protein YrrD